MKERDIRTHDGGKLALYSYGTEDAPGERRVVLIGGAFLTALIYRPFSVALSKGLGDGWAVDVYDRRGRGKSTEQPPTTTPWLRKSPTSAPSWTPRVPATSWATVWVAP